MLESVPRPVSVVTPAYNSARTLRRACESLAAQSFSQWEHIIINDGSTDDTADVAQTIAASDKRVRVFTTVNRGQGAALNIGVSHAVHPWIAFLDADDEYLPNHLEAHIEFFARNPLVDLTWGGVEVIAAEPEDAFVPDVLRGAGLVHVSECVVQGTLFVRRKVFDQLSFAEDRSIWYQDYEFVRQAQARFQVARFPFATYRYYRNSAGSLVSLAKRHWVHSASSGS